MRTAGLSAIFLLLFPALAAAGASPVEKVLAFPKIGAYVGRLTLEVVTASTGEGDEFALQAYAADDTRLPATSVLPKGRVLVAFSLTPKASVVIQDAPTWLIARTEAEPVPVATVSSLYIRVLTLRNGIATWHGTYAASVSGNIIRTATPHCDFPERGISCPSWTLLAGSNYIFELIEVARSDDLPH
jgi:hypothetical protein